jgi:hypothetical protein
MRYFIGLLSLAGLLCVATPVLAKPAKVLGSFGNWRAYAVAEDKQAVCYMVLTAHTAYPRTKKNKAGRGEAHLIITHRPVEGSTDVVSYEAGYSFNPSSDVKVHIGKNSFSLFTDKDTAWARDPHTDHLLSADIRKEAFITINGLPVRRGATRITDKIQLQGADQAYTAIGKACGLIKEPSKKQPTAKTGKNNQLKAATTKPGVTKNSPAASNYAKIRDAKPGQ